MNPFSKLKSDFGKIFAKKPVASQMSAINPNNSLMSVAPQANMSVAPKVNTPAGLPVKPTSNGVVNNAKPQVLAQQQSLTQQAASGIGAIPGMNTQTGEIFNQMGAINPPSNNVQPAPVAEPTSPAPVAEPTTPNPLEGQYAALQNMSPEENQAQDQLTNFQESARLGVNNLEGQGRGIPLSLVRGQQGKLLEQGQIQEQTLQQRLANAQQKRQASIDSVKFQLDRSDKAQARTDNLSAQKADETYRQSTLAETIRKNSAPEKQSVSEKYGTGAIGEYQFAKENGYKGSFTQYQTEDANRKIAIQNGSGLSGPQLSAFNSLADKQNKSPLIEASDRTVVLKDTISRIKADPSNGAQQLNLVYSYIQALDTYQSAVREGELGLVSSIDSKIGQFTSSIQKIQNGQIVRPEAILQMANAANDLVNTIERGATSKRQQFKSQADVQGLGDVWGKYMQGVNNTTGAGNAPSTQNVPTSGGLYNF